MEKLKYHFEGFVIWFVLCIAYPIYLVFDFVLERIRKLLKIRSEENDFQGV